ncbi:hypothetical protein V5799_001916 [Amblyomma americanum]|uniref:Uncharacterized protein n=1 Tax=Amblyomma americanum TaxID=6943 RepID=A0AAQ4CYA0_AMBAM
MTAWFFSGDLVLLATSPGIRGVTSPKNTTIKQSPHRFVFCGHDGRGLAMTPTRTLFCVLQGIFQIGASTATSGYPCGDRSDIVGVYTLRPDHPVDQMTTLLFSRDLALLATPPGSRGVTSPETTNIQEARHPVRILWGIFQIGASTATSGYTCGDRSDIVGVYQLRPDYTVDQMTAWLFSGDLTLLATPPGSRDVMSPKNTIIKEAPHRRGVTSPESTTIKEAPHRFEFCGHDGRGLAITLKRTLFCVLQGIFQIGVSTATSAYTCGDRRDIVGVYQLRPDYTVDQMTALLYSRDLALLSTPPGSRGVTSPETTNIQEALHRFVFSGHDGRGLAMTPTRTLFCVLYGIFQIGVSTATSAYTCGDRSDIVGVYTLRPDHTVDQMTAWLFSGGLLLLATPPGSRGVTSPKNTTIKQSPHRFVFCGHDGRGLAMTPTRTLFCVLQGIFQIGASTAASGYPCGDRSNIVGVYQLRPDYTVDQMTAWLFSGDLTLLATPPGSRDVTSAKNTIIKKAPHRFVLCRHDGRGLAITLTRTLFCVLQSIFQIGASTATSAYTCGDRSDIVGVYQLLPDYTVDQMTAWLFSGDLTLLATPPGSRDVTSPKNTIIKEAPHRFVLCRHDGRGLAITLTRTLFCVLQSIFQIGASTATSAYTCGDRSDIVGVYQLRPDYTVDQMTALLYSRDLALLATSPGSRGVTSPETTNIQDALHRFVFSGYDGRGLAMTPTRTLFCVLQGIFQIGVSTATSAYTCGYRSDIVGVYQLRPDYAVDQMTALLFSWDLALLATSPGSRGVTSPETTNIQDALHRFVFSGYDGRGLAMTPTRTLFCVLQGIFQIGVSTATSAYTCGYRSDIVGVYQLRPDYAVDQMTALLFSWDLALLATPPGSRGVTSLETTNIQEARHRFVFCGHDGRGLAMTPTRTLFCVLQGIFLIGASTATSAYTYWDRSDIVGVYQLRPELQFTR